MKLQIGLFMLFTIVGTSKSTAQSFYFRYSFSGLGGNIGEMGKTINVFGRKLFYNYEQNSFFVKATEKPDTICTEIIRPSSIDSILALVNPLAGKYISRSNPCIMSGGIHFLAISDGTDTAKFELDNTFDYTALKLIAIINQYLPQNNPIRVSKEDIIMEQECWDGIKKKD